MDSKNNKRCGVDCLRVVFNHFNKPQPYSKILEYNKIRNGINHIYDIGYAALKLGFQAKIIAHDFYIFGGSDSKRDIETYIKKRIYHGIGKDAAESLKSFIDINGTFELRIPTLEDIDDYLGKRIPVIIGVRPKIIKDKIPAKFLHYIVLITRKGNKYKIIDPCGDKYYIDKTVLIYAWYSRMAQLLVVTN